MFSPRADEFELLRHHCELLENHALKSAVVLLHVDILATFPDRFHGGLLAIFPGRRRRLYGIRLLLRLGWRRKSCVSESGSEGRYWSDCRIPDLAAVPFFCNRAWFRGNRAAFLDIGSDRSGRREFVE